MVYDERGNFVGDMHWQREGALDEGDEVQLERGGVIVQVVECVGRQEQDLSELLEKRAKEKEQRQARVAVHPSISAESVHTPSTGTRVQDHFQTRHRPLNQLLGTPTGHHGRAVVPNESPFELRQRADNMSVNRSEARSAKRRKVDLTPPSKKGYAQSLFGATLSLSAVPLSSAPREGPPATYRGSPETTGSQEEGSLNTETTMRDDGRRYTARTDPRATSSRSNAIGTSSEMPPRHDSDETPGHGVALASSARSLLQFGPELAGSDSRRLAQHSPAAGDHCSSSVGVDRDTASVVALATAPKGSERRLGARNAKTATEVQTGLEKPPLVADAAGATLPQAILLDDGPGRRLVGGENISALFAFPSGTTAPKRAAPSPARRRPEKQNSLRVVTDQLPVARSRSPEPHPGNGTSPKEQRTELRLKPRQKRGLLLLTEKRNKSRQPSKQRSPPAGEQSRTIDGLELPLNATSSGLQTHVGDETAGQATTGPIDSLVIAPIPTPDLPAASEHPMAGLPLQPQPLDSDRIARRRDGVASRLSMAPDVTADTSEPEEAISVRTEYPSVPTDHIVAVMKGKPTAPAVSNRDQKARQKRKISPKKPERTQSTAISGAGESTTDAVHEVTELGVARRTRKATSRAAVHSKLSREASRVDSEESDDGEPLPAKTGPRLARLSRKSVRSKEVFGFVPSSSPPVLNIANPFPSVPGARRAKADPAATAGAPCSPDPAVQELPDSGSRQPLLEKPRNTLQPTAQPRDIALVSQQDGLPPGAKKGRVISSETMKQEGEGFQLQPLGDSSIRGGVPRQASADGPEGVARAETLKELISVPAPQSIAAPQMDIAPITTRFGSVDHVSPSAAAITARRPDLHSASRGPEQPGLPISDAGEIGVEIGATENATIQVLDAQPAEHARPRIANPATRGRKAALKSDAAGQAPQSILPVEPPPIHATARPAAVPRREPAVNERPKRKMTFPGFISAKAGGPWSREAHDLLESGRPAQG